jgi:predicted Zn-dependent peptidase
MKAVIGECGSRKVTIRATLDAGAALEYGSDCWQFGTAHMVEHMIFQGTNDMTNKELTRNLAMLGADWNGFTWHDKVSFYVTVPVENAVEAAKLLQGMLFGREFDEQLFDKEKLVVLEEERGVRDDVESNIIEKLDKFLCTGPLSASIIGSEDDIKSITFDDIQKFHGYFYKPENLLLTVTGPEDAEFNHIIDVFGKDTGKFKRWPKVPNKFLSAKHIKLRDQRVNQARIFISYRAFPFVSKNALVLSFADKFLGDDMDSRLFQRVRQKHGLCYAISSSASLYQDIGWYVIVVRTSANSIKKVTSLVNKEIELLVKDGPTEEEMLRARNKYFSEVYGIIETSYGLNAMLSTRAFNNLPELDVSLDRVRNMTIKNVKTVCSKVFKPANRQLFTYVPEEE